MNYGGLRDSRTEIANFPNSGKRYPIFAWEVAYESDPCYHWARLHYLLTTPDAPQKRIVGAGRSRRTHHLATFYRHVRRLHFYKLIAKTWARREAYRPEAPPV
jgi:hypothetical protein